MKTILKLNWKKAKKNIVYIQNIYLEFFFLFLSGYRFRLMCRVSVGCWIFGKERVFVGLLLAILKDIVQVFNLYCILIGVAFEGKRRVGFGSALGKIHTKSTRSEGRDSKNPKFHRQSLSKAFPAHSPTLSNFLLDKLANHPGQFYQKRPLIKTSLK